MSTSAHNSAKQESKGRRAPFWIAIGVLLLAALAVWWYASRNAGSVALGQVSGDLHALQFGLGDRIFYGQHSGLQISNDGGGTWTAPSSTGDAMAIASSPKTPEVIYQAGHDLFLRSTDGGETWTEPGFGNLPGTDIHGFAVAPETGTRYANIAGQGLYRSPEGDNSWEFVSSATAGAMAIAAGPGTPPVL